MLKDNWTVFVLISKQILPGTQEDQFEETYLLAFSIVNLQREDVLVEWGHPSLPYPQVDLLIVAKDSLQLKLWIFSREMRGLPQPCLSFYCFSFDNM